MHSFAVDLSQLIVFFFFSLPLPFWLCLPSHYPDRVQWLLEGLPQLPGVLGLRQCQEPRRGGTGRGEPTAAVSPGQRGALHEHPARGGPRWLVFYLRLSVSPTGFLSSVPSDRSAVWDYWGHAHTLIQGLLLGGSWDLPVLGADLCKFYLLTYSCI